MLERMTKSLRVFAAVAVTSAVVAGAAAAQEEQPRITVGVGGDWVMYSPFLDAGPGVGAGVHIEDGISGSFFVDYWVNPWLAVHGDVVHGKPKLAAPGQYDGLNVSAVSLGAMVRPLGPSPVTPYLLASAGLMTYGLGGPSIRLTNTSIILDTGETEQLMLQGGAGVDVTFLRRSDHVTGIRVEAAHMHLFDRPFRVEGSASEGGQGHWRVMVGVFNSLW